MLSGEVNVFAISGKYEDITADWNRDPKTGTKAPMRFGTRLDYRDPRLVGDIKYLWEPNRHLELVALAQGYYATGQNRYIDALRTHLERWMEQCPYLIGPNWSSALELGIRLINWSAVWQLIGGCESEAFSGRRGKLFRDRWLEAVYRHAQFIQGRYSRYSSANNHLIGEAAGVFIASVAWPFWRSFGAWGKEARGILEEEILRQNFPDGVNREQAIAYQQFVLEFFLLAELSGRRNGVCFSRTFLAQMERMLEYIASVIDVGGNVPMFGDADDAVVISLAEDKDFCPFRSLLAAGAVLFKRGDLKKKSAGLDEQTHWLVGDEGEKQFRELESEGGLPVRTAFPDGGYYILGSDWETPEELRIVADAGELGYLSIAAHGHADLLSMTLSLGGQEFLVDTGTYAYHTEGRWRDYFRGTAAHNTVRVDNQDQAVIGGSFMWLTNPAASCEVWQSDEEADRFVGRHDGYMRLPDPVRHQREILLRKRLRQVRVVDTLLCRKQHIAERLWHFSENCDVEIKEGFVEARSAGRKIRLCDRGHRSSQRLVRGEDFVGGWISRGFDRKSPTTSVIMTSAFEGTTTFETEIECE